MSPAARTLLAALRAKRSERNIAGMRNPRLRRAAVAEARRILRLDTPAARWIARDALRELGAV